MHNFVLTERASVRKCKSHRRRFMLCEPIYHTIRLCSLTFFIACIHNSRKVIVRRIPEDKKGSYTDNDITKQAMIFESLLFKFKLSYGYYLDVSTLEKRIITLTSMTLRPRKNMMTRMPKLIVQIDMEMKKK